MNSTLLQYECRLSGADTQNPTLCIYIFLNFLHSQMVGMQKPFLASRCKRSHPHVWLIPLCSEVVETLNQNLGSRNSTRWFKHEGARLAPECEGTKLVPNVPSTQIGILSFSKFSDFPHPCTWAQVLTPSHLAGTLVLKGGRNTKPKIW